MAIAASLRLLRRMHSPSCTYSPAAWQHQLFSLEGGGACLSVTIYNHRPYSERTGRSRLSTGRSLYRTRVRSTYSVQCTVHSTFYYCYRYGTSASWSERPGEAGDQTPQGKKRSSFLVNCLMCFNPWIIYLFRCTSDIARVTCLLEHCSRRTVLRKLSCTDARKVLLPHIMSHPLFLVFLHWLV